MDKKQLLKNNLSKKHLLEYPLEDWKKLVTELDEPAYRAKQLIQWVFKQGKMRFEDMGNLPKAMIQKLSDNYTLGSFKSHVTQTSKDGTVKWMFETHDAYHIECVMIPDVEANRFSICISSQVGCALACKFCSTGKMGLTRNLTLGEIVEQFITVNNYVTEHYKEHQQVNNQGAKRGLTNIIFMGMGEPLQNLENVGAACRIFSSEEAFNLAKRKITVSTSGLLPQIEKWGERFPDYKLAVSLNGANETTRTELMPINKRYPLKDLLRVVDNYIRTTGQRLTFEYILIKDLTCTDLAAKELKNIAQHRNCKLNLIPMNGEGYDGLKAPSEEEIERFYSAVSGYDYPVMLRKPRGRDISAACGQLVYQQKKVA